jgi:hypothetical protein
MGIVDTDSQVALISRLDIEDHSPRRFLCVCLICEMTTEALLACIHVHSVYMCVPRCRRLYYTSAPLGKAPQCTAAQPRAWGRAPCCNAPAPPAAGMGMRPGSRGCQHGPACSAGAAACRAAQSDRTPSRGSSRPRLQPVSSKAVCTIGCRCHPPSCVHRPLTLHKPVCSHKLDGEAARGGRRRAEALFLLRRRTEIPVRRGPRPIRRLCVSLQGKPGVRMQHAYTCDEAPTYPADCAPYVLLHVPARKAPHANVRATRRQPCLESLVQRSDPRRRQCQRRSRNRGSPCSGQLTQPSQHPCQARIWCGGEV